MQRVLVHFTDPVLGLLFSAVLSPGLAFLAVAEGAISIAETLVKS
jgi:hypothetical protein